MTPMEIALLVIGVIIFVLSFLLPNGNEKKSEKQMTQEREEIHDMMEQELDGMKLRVNEAANDSIDYAVDRAERSLEKVSNEKIMAVNEYGQTIIEEINKNHQEVMFLYDMLKDKHTDLTNSVREADAAAKRIEKLSKNARSASKGLESELNVVSATKKGLTSEQRAVFDVFDNMEIGNDFAPIAQNVEHINEQAIAPNVQEVVNEEPVMPGVAESANAQESRIAMDIMSGTVYKPDKTNESMMPVLNSGIKKEASKNEATNNNQRILELHNSGMATVDIARELKLGVGEVKLVIDLFK